MAAGRRCGPYWLVVAALVVLCEIAQLQAATVYVSTPGSDASNGQTWSTAKATVQAGLNAAAPGDQVWVSTGTYVGPVTLKADVSLYGGFVGSETQLEQRNWIANVTVLDGNQAGSTVTVPPEAAQGVRIDGFTIRNASASQCGVYCNHSSPTIANNVISGNSGSGIYCFGGSPVVANNMISGNCPGITCQSTYAVITGNTIIGNSTTYGGAGILCVSSAPVISNNTIVGNSTRGGYGDQGAIYCGLDSSPRITNTIVAFNSSGICLSGPGAPSLRHNCVYGNVAFNYAGLTDPTGRDGNIAVDPGLAGVPYGRTHVQPGSPCVDSGDDGEIQGDWPDMDGQNRVQGVHVDIGADESDGTVWPAGPAMIVRVSPVGSDANDGSSWALAKRTLQAAIDAAARLDGEVWVRSGTYAQRIALRRYVHVYGGFAGTETHLADRDWSVYSTVLDGMQGGSVVTATEPGYALASLDGFTIRNGSGTASGTSRYGGGIYCVFSSPVIANNTIRDSSASHGAGIYFSYSASVVTGNTITGNTAANAGGGIYCDQSCPTIARNMISANRADGTLDAAGGGISCNRSFGTITENTIISNYAKEGGGVYCYYGGGTIANNRITNNTAFSSGGGIRCNYHCSARIANNTITGNEADFGGGIYCSDNSSPTIEYNNISSNRAAQGGGISCVQNASPKIVRNMITGNLAGNGGGGNGIYCYYGAYPDIVSNTISGNQSEGIYCCNNSSPRIANNVILANGQHGISCTNVSPRIDSNTIVGNRGAGIWFDLGSYAAIVNTIVAFNSRGVSNSVTGTPSLWHNCVYGNTLYNYGGIANPTGTRGNISADPRFVMASAGADGKWGTADDVYGDVHLLPGSPCIDAGNSAYVPPDVADMDGDGDTVEPLPVDLAGAPRFGDDPYKVDTGSGTPPIVDVGAYEHRCGDVTGDGFIDVVDLLWLVDAFSSHSGDSNYDARCDFNADGAVDVNDLLDLVHSFGM